MRALLLLILLSSSSLLAQSRCSSLIDYRDSCRTITAENQCSTQLREVCCSCEQEWEEDFEVCKFTQAAFPTPTPQPTPTKTATPTATPVVTPQAGGTPRPGGLPGSPESEISKRVPPSQNGVSCKIEEVKDSRVCGNGVATSRYKITTSPSVTLYNWAFECPEEDRALLYRSDFNETLPIFFTDEVILWMPDPSKTVQCNIRAVISATGKDGTQTYARCISENLFAPCEFECASTSIKGELLTMDGRASEMLKLIKSQNSMMKRANIGNASKKLSIAKKIYLQLWEVTWQLPPFLLDCNNALACQSYSLESNANMFRAGIGSLKKISKKLDKKLRQSGKLSRSQLRRVKKMKRSLLKAEKESIESLAKIPLTGSSC